MDSQITAAIKAGAVNGEVACADAHEIAARFGVSPLALDPLMDDTHLRFNRCQLGLFGYGSKAEGKSKIVLKASNVPPEIEAAIKGSTVNGRIACKIVWDIADQFQYPRLGVANIIEALGIRVSPCQLGCF
jgi:hypothetical protein